MSLTKYIFILLITASSLLSNTFKQGKFESCETNYFSMYEVTFVASDEMSCYKVKSKLNAEVYTEIKNSFEKGTFDSCGLLGCSVDYIGLK